jgi:hypothetical protein
MTDCFAQFQMGESVARVILLLVPVAYLQLGRETSPVMAWR